MQARHHIRMLYPQTLTRSNIDMNRSLLWIRIQILILFGDYKSTSSSHSFSEGENEKRDEGSEADGEQRWGNSDGLRSIREVDGWNDIVFVSNSKIEVLTKGNSEDLRSTGLDSGIEGRVSSGNRSGDNDIPSTTGVSTSNGGIISSGLGGVSSRGHSRLRVTFLIFKMHNNSLFWS